MNVDNVFRINNLLKVYGERPVVDINALDIEGGEILALVGPSGSGKSTFLRLLNFLEPATDGIIEFAGVPYEAGKTPTLEQRRTITTVFQHPMLLNRSVWDNVTFGLRLRGRRNGDEHVMQVLEQVGLAGLNRQRARSLSGGEAQRVALARAMVIEPRVLLMDEPTANLDPANVAMIETIVEKLNREQGVTVILVTHNVFQAHRLAHRVALLLDGRIVETAETERFFNNPADPRTRAFVNGEMVY